MIALHLKLIKLIRKIVKMLHIVNYERSTHLTLSVVASHLLLLLSMGIFILSSYFWLHYTIDPPETEFNDSPQFNLLIINRQQLYKKEIY